MTTIVLGWDGLDYELAERFGLFDDFGPYHTQIETYNNPVIDLPHTHEIWPSIITGVHRNEHGLWVARDHDRKEWSNPVIDLASRLAEDAIPKSVREKIGALLQQAEEDRLNQATPEYYTERGLSTVFDGRRSYAISVPNYETALDEEYGFDSDRSTIFEHTVLPDGSENFEPLFGPLKIDERLSKQVSERLGVVKANIQYDHDLVFVWLGYLDTVGHLAPVRDEAGWYHRCYQYAASLTADIRSCLAPDDTLICVSDHGLQGGEHTHNAFFGATDETLIENVESVLDVRDAIDSTTAANDPARPPSVRDAFQGTHGRVGEAYSHEKLHGQLEDLGYL